MVNRILRHFRPVHSRLRWVLLVVAFALWTGFNINTPLFEAPDEHHHFYTAKFITDTGSLPIADIGALFRQEAAQPPLYYAVAAQPLRLLKLGDAPTMLIGNPLVEIPTLNARVNVNAFVHSHAEAWPWRGLALAVHLLRILSALAGMVTLLSIYATAKLLWPNTPLIALCAAGLAAFLPQFGFIHGVMTNDSFLIASCSLVLYLFAGAALEDFPMRYGIGIGVGVGLAILTKMTGVALALYTGAWMFGLTWYAMGWRRALRLTMLYGVVALLLSAWLFWRNQTLYGDPTAVSIFVQFGGGERAYSWGLLRAEFGRIWRSAIGVFGWMNVPAPDWVMTVWLSIMAAGLLGLMVALAQLMRRPQRVIVARQRVMLFVALLTWPIVVIGFWLQFLWRTPADQGRLLFPALLPLALLLAYGLACLGGIVTVGAALCMAFLTAFSSAFVQLPRTYNLPKILTRRRSRRRQRASIKRWGRGFASSRARLITLRFTRGKRSRLICIGPLTGKRSNRRWLPLRLLAASSSVLQVCRSAIIVVGYFPLFFGGPATLCMKKSSCRSRWEP